jgi:hypothetical protein
MVLASSQTGAELERQRHAMPEISLPSFPFTSQQGWSRTSAETFRSCRLQYFYQYYGKFDLEIPLEGTLPLKRLSRIQMTTEAVTHDELFTSQRKSSTTTITP